MAALKPHPPWKLKLKPKIAVPSHILNFFDDVTKWKVTIDKTDKSVTWEDFTALVVLYCFEKDHIVEKPEINKDNMAICPQHPKSLFRTFHLNYLIEAAYKDAK